MEMNSWCIVFTLSGVLIVSTHGYFNPFSDTVIHQVNWPGDQATQSAGDNGPLSSEENAILMTTKHKETYKCILPSESPSSKDSLTLYTGPSELELLGPLLSQITCSYRIESYWTYELCHGKYIRQYHETKESVGKKSNIQEYYLGRLKEKPSVSEEKITTEGAVTTVKKVKTKKIEGLEMGYYQINMTDGTPCDLTAEHRTAAILYVCHAQGKGEVYELKEISSCTYEVVVLTSALCEHPDYKSKNPSVNNIWCHSTDGSPKRPKSLDSLTLESVMSGGKKLIKRSVAEFLPDTTEHEDKKAEDRAMWDSSKGKHGTDIIGTSTDRQLLQEFLAGVYCLHGGVGWWQHEFCFGRHAKQYHQEKHGGRTDILLGVWDAQKHMQWLEKHPMKKPRAKGQRTQISQFYGDGEVCDLTGRPRQVEVKLKCKESAGQPHAVTLYLLEPKSCEYTLGIESPILCSIMDEVDENGIFTPK